MLKTLLAAVAIVGLIAAALTSIRLAEGSGCSNNCVVSEPFTLHLLSSLGCLPQLALL